MMPTTIYTYLPGDIVYTTNGQNKPVRCFTVRADGSLAEMSEPLFPPSSSVGPALRPSTVTAPVDLDRTRPDVLRGKHDR